MLMLLMTKRVRTTEKKRKVCSFSVAQRCQPNWASDVQTGRKERKKEISLVLFSLFVASCVWLAVAVDHPSAEA